MSQASTAAAYRIWGICVRKKPENKLLDLFAPELLSAPSREQMTSELRARAERLYHEASVEEIIEATRLVEELLEARGVLPKKGSTQIY
jgi:hypothetical protein